ncbi:hypothetical protein BpHYR1_008173 [Brachionus plicatilis]|uniref:Uncharacterized protein n=1 Tax=Brachionus plicatilis TaxID=10195 RepID=A0A3M7PS80_BRAPC|nr:hypothetical protein BpHYR1_008173 [Brachionus plicatilis]
MSIARCLSFRRFQTNVHLCHYRKEEQKKLNKMNLTFFFVNRTLKLVYESNIQQFKKLLNQ